MTDTILLIGSGGREHALAWKLSQSPKIKHIFVAPGNAGTHASEKISNIALNIKSNEQIAQWCKENKIDLVVVGPEDPLANGIADFLTQNGVKCFGPSQKAAQIEASKEFAKSFMYRHNIPTAKWRSFTNAEEAENYILSTPNALVVKASGLAAGKGVIVASSQEEAVKAVHDLKKDLSSASETIVVEELLEGEEISVLCFSDGTNISRMPPAQDHKRLLDNDEGPNTGGMGAYCRCPQISNETLKTIEEKILKNAINGMTAEGNPYIGVLYAGLMMTKDGPKVLEFNCRFGDPETQVILPLLTSDLYEIMLSCVDGNLNKIDIKWSNSKYAVGVVVVSGGYPGSYPKGKVITGLDKLSSDYIVFHAGTALNENNVVTSGGRVLAVVAVERTLEEAACKAKKGASEIHFDGAFYRKDIAHRALKRSASEGMTYKSSGVDIENADALVNKIKSLTKQTLRPGVCGGIGGFGGIFDLKYANYNDAYLISRGCGISEKLMVLQDCNNYESIGYDLVSNSVNEILSHGAEPLFFLDTYTTAKLETSVAAQVIQGIVKGCKESNCVLIGGETAEMPGMYADGDFDLTGFARGAVEKENLLPQKNISNGDSVIALVSSSINPYSYRILRKILRKEKLTLESPFPYNNNINIKDCVTAENKIHVQSVLPLMKKNYIKASAYINEGGITENVKRILPTSCKIALNTFKWTIPPVFKWMAEAGHLSENEIMENFNCGIDMVLIVDKDVVTTVLNLLESSGEEAVVIGSVEACQKGDKQVEFLNSPFTSKHSSEKIKVAVFCSGQASGTEALLEYSEHQINVSSFEVVLVISDSNNSCGILNAQKKNVPTKVFNQKDFEEAGSSSIKDCLKLNNIQLICLDNFSSKLSNELVKSWEGQILSTHPSLLPAFDTPAALKDMLNLQVRITGCTVFFLEPGKKFGGIIDQAATFVEPDDNEEALNKKISQLEQYIYPKAVELVATKRVVYGADSKMKCIDDDCLVTNAVKYNYDAVHAKITPLIQSTARTGWKENIHSLCGIFDLKASGYEDPYLVSGTDGVGTKLKIAQICKKHDTIGIDLVAMCVNDILTHGAEPLFFMQCFNCGNLNLDIVSEVMSGIANGCKQANCVLINSEISVLPDIYLDQRRCIPDFENYDVVGYAEGALEKDSLLPKPKTIEENDILIGLESSGIHSNGYSLVRKLVKIRNLSYQSPAPFDSQKTLGEVLLTPTKIYVKSLLPLMKKGYIKAAAHITGGGLIENIPRVLPEDCKVVLDGQKWSVPPVFKWIATEGHLADKEMLRTFNCGLGMVLIISKEHENEVLSYLKKSGENASNVGCVRKLQSEGDEKVEVRNFTLAKQSSMIKKKKVGVLISGSGTNLQALIDYTQNPSNQSKAEIALVFSNVPGVEGLKRAERANIPTEVLSHKGFKSRVEFDMAMNKILEAHGIEIVCLAGFMRILSKDFVEKWQGKLLNVHPAILPAFKGANAHKLVLEAGAKITGCTVHFVEAEVDAGAIIEQAAVRVDNNDTEKSLQEKVKVLEHQIFPAALELLASEKISRGKDGKLIRH